MIKRLTYFISLLILPSIPLAQHSLSFDGVNDYVTIPYNISLNSFTDQMTVSAWVKVSGSSLKTVISNGNEEGFAFMVNEDNAFYVNVQNQSGWSSVYVQQGQAITSNTWNHLVLTYDGKLRLEKFI